MKIVSRYSVPLAVRPSRRDVLIAGAALITAPLVQGQIAAAQGRQAPASSDGRTVGWASYGGDKASTKYSALAQIDRDNFSRLRVAWTWQSVEADVVRANPGLRTWAWESTPLMVDGVLYVSTSLSQVAALDAATGKTKWVYDPETWKNGTPSNNGFVHRGVAFWADGNDRRIVFGTGDGYLICLDAQTGRPVVDIRTAGAHRSDAGPGSRRQSASLRRLVAADHLPRRHRDGVEGARCARRASRCRPATSGASTSAPASSSGSSGRPAEGEFGNETWENDSWKTTGERTSGRS